MLGLGVFLVAAVLLSAFALDRENRAQSARTKAEREADVNHSLVLANNAVEEFKNGFDTLSLMLALKAVDMDQPPPEAISALSNLAFNLGTRAILQEDGNAIHTVAFSPNSTLGLSGSCAELNGDRCTEGELILWDIAASSELHRFVGHTDWVNSAVFSPNGLTILSGSSDTTLILWDVQTGAVLRRFEGHTGVINSVIFSRDGKTAISGADDMTLIEWDVQSGAVLRRLEGHTGPVTCLALSADGQTLASGSTDTTILVWDITTGEPIYHLEGHTARIDDLTFLPGDKGLLSVGDLRLMEWNLETGELKRSADIVVSMASVDVTPDGRTAVVTPGVGIRLWDMTQWRTTDHVAQGWKFNTAGVLSS